MSSADSITQWADDMRSDDPRTRDEAARRIWELYSTRLLALVRRNLAGHIRRREDEDDVLQSMYRSFCLGQRQAEEPLRSRDDLWRMLVHIAMCKVANTARRHQAGRRDVRREQGDAGSFPGWVLEQMVRSEPSPEEGQVLEDELQQWLRPLPEDLRRIALWKLEGYTNQEIGARIGRTERSVELKMHILRGCLEKRLAAVGPPGTP